MRESKIRRGGRVLLYASFFFFCQAMREPAERPAPYAALPYHPSPQPTSQQRLIFFSFVPLRVAVHGGIYAHGKGPKISIDSTVQYSTVQYSTVQYSTEQYSTEQYSTEQYSTVQYSTVQYSTEQYLSLHTGSVSRCIAV